MSTRSNIRRHVIVWGVSMVVATGILGCHDFDFYAAMMGMHNYVTSIESMGHVYAISESEYPQQDYIYVAATGEMLDEEITGGYWQAHQDAWEAVEDHRVYAVDVTDARAPVVGAYLSVASPPVQILRSINAWALIQDSGITMLDVSDPANPVAADTFAITTYAASVRLWQGYPMVVSGSFMTVIDTEDPAAVDTFSETAIGDLTGTDGTDYAYCFAVTDELIAFGRRDSVVIATLSTDPGTLLTNPSPTLASRVSIDGYPEDMVFLTETRLAVYHRPGVVTVFDVTNPATPTEISRTDGFTEGGDTRLRISNGSSLLMVGSNATMWGLDFSDSAESPERKFGYTLPGAPTVFFSFLNKGYAMASGADDYGYILAPAGNHGLAVYRAIW